MQIGSLYLMYLMRDRNAIFGCVHTIIMDKFRVHLKIVNFVQFLGKILSGDQKIRKVDKILVKKIWFPFGITLG